MINLPLASRPWQPSTGPGDHWVEYEQFVLFVALRSGLACLSYCFLAFSLHCMMLSSTPVATSGGRSIDTVGKRVRVLCECSFELDCVDFLQLACFSMLGPLSEYLCCLVRFFSTYA